jgi:hypothetical protein
MQSPRGRDHEVEGDLKIRRSEWLELRDDRGADTPLVPLFRDGFDGPDTVRFERDSTGIVTAMTFTTRGVDALPFTRVRERADGRAS